MPPKKDLKQKTLASFFAKPTDTTPRKPSQSTVSSTPARMPKPVASQHAPSSDPIDVDMEEIEPKTPARGKRKGIPLDSDEEVVDFSTTRQRPPVTPGSSSPECAIPKKRRKVTVVESDDEDDASSVASNFSKRLSHYKKSPKKSTRKSRASDDDDFIVHSESEDDVKPTKSSRPSSRASIRTEQDDSDEDPEPKKKPAKAKPTPKSQSTTSGKGKEFTFLTAAEQRTQNKKDEKKAADSPYAFLEDQMDKDKNRPGDPKYDPRTLYIPKKAWAEFTPFEKQFWEIKQNHYDTILFFQKGKFLELYEEDARVGHREFDLKLTQRVKMSMVGVPEMAFSFWAAKFLGKGYKVGRVDQAETALGAEMRLKKGEDKNKDKIVKRELNKVYTNGTLVDTELLRDEQAGHCIAISEDHSESMENSTFGIAILDCSTSQFDLCAFKDDICRTKLETMVRQLRPKEILYKKDSLSVSTVRLLKAVLPAACLWTSLRDVEGYDYDQTVEELNHIYPSSDHDMESDEASVTEGIPPCVRGMLEHRGAIASLGCLIWYLRQLNIDKDILGMKNFNIYDPVKKGQGLILDGQSLAHLEILLNNEGTEEGSLLQLLSRCVTPAGKRLFRLWLCMPLRDVSDINARLDAVEDILGHPTFEDSFTKIAKGLPDLERTVARIHANNCKTKDFIKVLSAFKRVSKGMGQLADESEHFKSKTILGLLRAAPDLLPHIEHVESMFLPPSGEKDEHLLPQEGKDEAYDEIEEEIAGLEKKLAKALKGLEKELGSGDKSLTYWHSATGTKDIYLVETSASQRNIPKAWTKSSSTKKVNRYIVPSIQKDVRSLKEARENRNAAIKSFRGRVYAEFDRDRSIWLRAVRVFSELDCLISLAKASAALDGQTCRPELVEGDSAWVDFQELSHPMLSASSTKQFIPNNVKLGGDIGKIALLTGPNMAGKSTLMRMTAVGVIMAQLGMLVPAKSARLCPVDAILTRMGAYDNMFSHASTFKVELDECCKILRDATPKSFIILDELGRGTSTYDGMAIAGAVLHKLATHTLSLSFFATHYGSLTDDYAYHPNIRNMHMSTIVDDDERRLVFLYKLVEGVAASSFGTHVASLAGVPNEVVDRAATVSKSFAEQFQLKHEDRKKSSPSNSLPLTAQADFAFLFSLATGRNSLQDNTTRQKETLIRLKEVVKRYKRI